MTLFHLQDARRKTLAAERPEAERHSHLQSNAGRILQELLQPHEELDRLQLARRGEGTETAARITNALRDEVAALDPEGGRAETQRPAA